MRLLGEVNSSTFLIWVVEEIMGMFVPGKEPVLTSPAEIVNR